MFSLSRPKGLEYCLSSIDTLGRSPLSSSRALGPWFSRSSTFGLDLDYILDQSLVSGFKLVDPLVDDQQIVLFILTFGQNLCPVSCSFIVSKYYDPLDQSLVSIPLFYRKQSFLFTDLRSDVFRMTRNKYSIQGSR